MSDADLLFADIQDQRRVARINAATSVDDNPDDAARAIDLEEDTGVPSEAIHGDLENFEATYKAHLTTQLLDGNEYLREFANSHPLAPKLAADDWGNLDKLSQSLHRMPVGPIGSAFGEAVKGFKEGFGSGQLGEWMFNAPGGEQFVKENRLSASIWSVLGLPIEVGAKVFAGALKGTEAGVEEYAKQSGIHPSTAKSLARETAAVLEFMLMQPGNIPHVQIHPEVVEAIQAGRSYIQAGKEPPLGVHKTFDDIKIEESKAQLEALGDAFKDAQATNMRERSPGMLAEAIRIQAGEAKIGINAEKVRELYGDKVPVADDGLLGWVPDLQEKLASAEAIGGDIEVPIADFLARIDPEVYKEIEDHIRVRKGGVTKEEAKGLAESAKAMVEAHHGSPHDFDVFSMEKIGTGEGAQSYGHGLYFAENPQVAGSYAQGRQTGKTVLSGLDLPPDHPFHGVPIMDVAPPTRYRVRIHADKEQFLDWDKPLGEQPEAAKGFMKNFSPQDVENFANERNLTSDQLLGSHVYDLAALHAFRNPDIAKGKTLREGASNALREAGIPGIKYLDQGSRKLADFDLAQRTIDNYTSEIAKIDEGIAQNKWNDHDRKRMEVNKVVFESERAELSRKLEERKKEGLTHNFVLFDESLVEITHKNDVEIVRAAAGLDPLGRARKLALRKVGSVMDSTSGQPMHAFNLMDESGKLAATLTIAEENQGKRLYVDDIRGEGDKGSQAFGLSAMRQVLQQLKAEFPNAEELQGFRVSGARDKAGTWESKGKVSIKLSTGDLETELAKLYQEHGLWEDLGLGFESRALDDGRSPKEKALVEAVDKEIAKLNLTDVDVELADAIRSQDTRQSHHGLYLTYTNKAFRPTILLALDERSPGTLRHEAIHFLREQGMLSDKEWFTLSRAARDQDWVKKHGIEETYSDMALDNKAKIEESIAEEFRIWKEKGADATTPIGKAFAKLQQIFDAIKRGLKQAFGKDLTAEEIFQEIESGRVGGREPGAAGEGGVKAAAGPREPELPLGGTTRMEHREPFAGSIADWMPLSMRRRYMELIAERNALDQAAATKLAEKATALRQSKEWKDAEKLVRPEVLQDIESRPDVATDLLLGEGSLFGDKVPKPKLRAEALTDEQKAVLPKDYIAADGVLPDNLAGVFGYPSGNTLVSSLALHTSKRVAAGQSPREYVNRLAQMETEAKLQERFNDPAERLIEIKDQVLSETQINLLHEDLLALGLANGWEYSINGPMIRQAVKNDVAKMPLSHIDSNAFMTASKRANMKEIEALQKKDFAEALKYSEKKFLATLTAKEALAIEKEQTQFERRAKRFQKKEVAGVEQEFTDFAQDLLADAEVGRRFGIETAEERNGYQSMHEFVGAKTADGWEMDVTDAIQAKQFPPLEQMTVEQFRDFKAAIDSLYKVGREVKKILVAGERVDYAEWKAGVLENIRTMPIRDPAKPVNARFWFDAPLTRIEEVMKDLDLRKEHGPLFGAVIRPMAESKHTEYSMIEALSKRLKDVRGDFGRDWRKTLSDTIPQDFLNDPYYAPNIVPFDLTREHMINIMLNFGNRSNIKKFTEGYAGKEKAGELEGQLRQLFDQHATKQDWEYVQTMWDTFKTWREDSKKLYYDLGGGRRTWIEPEAITTAHGEFEGGYWPVMFDKIRSRMGTVQEPSTQALFGPNYHRATPANHYTKERTGYVDRVAFQNTLEQLGARMQQQIHDISYRRAIMDVAKIIKDPEIRGAIRKHYGKEYEDQLMPWLKDIANHFDMEEQSLGALNAFMRRMRMNLMGSALGLNLRVILSPDVGALNPAAVARYNAYPDHEAFVMSHSKELPHTFRNMDRDFRERMELVIKQKGWQGVQADATKATLWPVALVSQGFRKVTFFDEFMKAKAKGWDDGRAAAWADSLVRERHGSGGLPDIPAIMRSNEFMKASTLFYGYFNTMYNWQRQIPGQVRAGEYTKLLQTFYGSVLIGSAFGGLLFNQQKEKDGWFKIIGKALALQPLSTVPFVRDAANFFMEGNTARTPFASLLQYGGSLAGDIKNVYLHKPVKKPISHAANVIGLYPGVPGMAQLGRTTQFGVDVYQGKQRPRNILEWTRGIIGGEARLKP